MNILFLAGAIFFICLAHFIRVLRWELFINIYEKPNRKNLIQSMSTGFFLNYFLPFKLGELVRAWLSGKKMKNGKALGFSTVIVDRYFDIVSVGIIFIIISIADRGGSNTSETATMYVIIAILLLILAMIIFVARREVKKGIRIIANIFNQNIEFAVLLFVWALIWNFKDMFQKISKWKLIILTICMWYGYLISYFMYAAFLNTLGIGTSGFEVFIMLFAQNGIKGSTGATTIYRNEIIKAYPIYMAIYMILPVVILFIISLFMSKPPIENEDSNYLRLLPHMDPKERLVFLENYFSNKNRDYVKNYLKINQGVSIIRDYSAGSNATTMLCMDDKSTFFRKYAFGDDGEKLYHQILWIEQNKNQLALPKILRKEKTEIYCFYDMPYSSNSVGLFEYAHSMPINQAWKIMQYTLESLESSIYKMNVRKADSHTIHKYVEEKVKKNLNKIKNTKGIKELQQYDTMIINGIEYKNLSYYEKYLSENYLQKIFSEDTYAVIHGDLTIENIICTRDDQGVDNFYIIDPNTGNIHDSPNLDYAKLLQSIHGGYEFLMSTKDINVSGNKINFLFTRSSAYIELHQLLKQYMNQQLGEKRTRSIYFHEIIHWLRLMPYKIEKNGKRALLFYAGMLIVMSDVINMYKRGAEG